MWSFLKGHWIFWSEEELDQRKIGRENKEENKIILRCLCCHLDWEMIYLLRMYFNIF